MGISIQLLINPHEGITRETSDYIIVVSDLHFGAYNSISRIRNSIPNKEHIIDFITLLQLLTDEKKFLKAIIILGDFLDLLTTKPKSIIEDVDFIKISQYFDEFKNHNIPVIIALGNHEISIKNNYNSNFLNRKENLIQKLDGLNNLIFCQGVLISDKDINFEVICNTSKKSMKKYHNHKIFLAHGFQFQNKLVRKKAIKKFWDPLLEEENILIKDFINQIWNYYLITKRPLNEINSYIDDFYQVNEISGNIWYHDPNKVKQYIKLYKLHKFWFPNKSNRRYNRRIVRFLRTFIKTEYYVIYGHTHLCQENMKYRNYSISNSGTWINTPKTSCIKIIFN